MSIHLGDLKTEAECSEKPGFLPTDLGSPGIKPSNSVGAISLPSFQAAAVGGVLREKGLGKPTAFRAPPNATYEEGGGEGATPPFEFTRNLKGVSSEFQRYSRVASQRTSITSLGTFGVSWV